MVDLKASGIQIVSSIIGSSLLVFAITTFYSDFFNTPNVSARIVPNINGTSIELTNNGRVPATNLILTVESPANIADYEIFTTENRTIMVGDNNHTLVAKFPRFVHGDGSLIKIELFSAEQEPDAFNQGYIVYATYDEGSLKIASQMERAAISIPYGMTIALTIAALLTFAIPYFYRRARRQSKYRKQKAVALVAENIRYYSEDRGHGDPLARDRNHKVAVIELSKSINKCAKDIFENKDDLTAASSFYNILPIPYL